MAAIERTILTITADTPEALLIAQAKEGSAVAFEAIMRRHNQRLFRTARSILKQDAEAEDAVQEAYIKAWMHLASFRADSQLSTWLTRIVANEALARRRKRSADVLPIDAAIQLPDEDESLLADEYEQPEQKAMQTELRAIIEAQIDKLPEAYRLVFMLRAVEEMRADEVAEVLNIPEATVRTRYFRAKGLLRESLAHETDKALEGAFSFDGERCNRIVAAVLQRAVQEGLSH